MLYENIKKIRKSRGFTQEELAARLNVTRQTISKWENGYSVPDAETLIKLADTLEVSVSELLGKETENIESRDSLAFHLARINEQLATKNRRSRRILKIVGTVLAIIVVIYGSLIIYGIIGVKNATNNFPAHVNLDGIETEVDPNNPPIEIVPESE